MSREPQIPTRALIAADVQPPDLNRDWVDFARNIISMLNRHRGPDITYRLSQDASVATMSEAELVDAKTRDFEAGALRKGYAEALRPLQERFVSGALKETSAEAWAVVFFIMNAQFRPKPEDLGKKVRKELKLPVVPVEGGVADSYQVVKAPRQEPVKMIPTATVTAAYKDVSPLVNKARRLEDIPERDLNGELIGIGRRRFLLAMARMKQGLRPLPSDAEAYVLREDEEGKEQQA